MVKLLFDIILRNLTQRKIRTGLTVSGIGLGIFAVIVMGGMSENFNQTFEKSFSLTAEKIRVFSSVGVFGGGLTNSKAAEVRKVPGVEDAYGMLMAPLEEGGGMSFGGNQVTGIRPEKSQVALTPIQLKDGRFLLRGDRYVTVIGSSIATQYNIGVGDRLEIEDKNFIVVGVLEYTGSFFDANAAIPLDIAQDIYDMDDMVSLIFALPQEGVDGDLLAKRIKLSVDGVDTLSPSELKKEAEQNLRIFSVITVSAAVLAALIGGLSVMNTMLMSVMERTKEFGILKAIGAQQRDILLMTVGEASIMGLMGGLLGLVSGWAVIYGMNLWLADQGIVLFLITPRLVAVAMLFAILLGTASGIYPAIRATRMSPMEALRYE
ncbi:MAG: putative ABC transport system permease protein [Candidatus Methanomarinus sp.]|nr:MAG: putative ABC transport system permease protein [ANME-2 cluster archaeon]KAF5425463.1 putative ABC transport system permease protein [ANME-2 cluster archaeon]